MKKDEHFSEEQINAFVDGELDPEEKSRLYNEAARSPDLDQRLSRQSKVKDLLKHAYENVPKPVRWHTARLSRGRFFGRSIAAAVFLVVGLCMGLLADNYFAPGRAAITGSLVEPVATANNYLLHLTSGEPEQMQAALRHAEELLQESDQHRVEIIANEKGLDLLRRADNPLTRDIAALQGKGVVFYACSRTIQRLEDGGERVELVPYVNANFTALDRVVSRMQEGWKYDKI